MDDDFMSLLSSNMDNYTSPAVSADAGMTAPTATPQVAGSVNFDPSTGQVASGQDAANQQALNPSVGGAQSKSKGPTTAQQIGNIAKAMQAPLANQGAPSNYMPPTPTPYQFQVQPTPQGLPPRPQLGMVYSDENLKTNIKDTPAKDVDEFVKNLAAKSFDYKNPADGTHTEGGLLAQDLQKSKIGRSVLVQTPKGLAVDTNKLSPILASIMSEKIQKMERRLEDAVANKFKKGRK